MKNDLGKLYDRYDVRELVANELESAVEAHGSKFADSHHAYAVLREEYEEAQNEMVVAKACMGTLWECIKRDEARGIPLALEEVRKRCAACLLELAQCLAVIEKWGQCF